MRSKSPSTETGHPIDSYLFEAIHFPTNWDYLLRLANKEMEQPWIVRSHFHDCYEIGLYQKITATVSLNGKPFPIGPHYIVLSPPYTVHSFFVESLHSLYFISQFRVSFLEHQDIPFSKLDRPWVQKLDEETFKTFWNFLTLAEEMESAITSPLKRDGLSALLNWVSIQQDFTPHSNEDALPSVLKRFLQKIDEEERYNLTLEESAKWVGISRSHFANLFTRHLGLPFNKFLTDRRLEAAKYFLSHTQLSITEIAHKLEFNDSSYLAKVFLKNIGVTPKEYRRQFDPIP